MKPLYALYVVNNGKSLELKLIEDGFSKKSDAEKRAKNCAGGKFMILEYFEV